jgi:mono/diheme cytochrome c family protein
VQAGKALWEINNTCISCHGAAGSGGFGPDLAGHRLTPAQFLRAVRKPWGVMPTYTPDKNFNDQEIGQIAAYLASLPKVAEPAPWRTPIPANASARQALQIAQGCGQCHGAELRTPRKFAGGEGADFEWFKNQLWTHTDAIAGHPMVSPRIRMGNFSRDKFPEFYLRELWEYFAVEAGLRVPVEAEIWPGPVAGSYKVIVGNMGHEGHGLAAEDITLMLPLPPGTTVVSTTGAGYQGVRRDEKTNADAATWKVPRLVAGQQLTYTLTLSGTGAGAEITKGNLVWAKPPLDAASSSPVESPVRKGAADGILRMRDVAGNAFIYTAP